MTRRWPGWKPTPRAHPSAVATSGRLLALAARPDPGREAGGVRRGAHRRRDPTARRCPTRPSPPPPPASCSDPTSCSTGTTPAYWPALEDIWESMSIGMATRVISGLFPGAQDLGSHLEHPVMAQLDAWLRGHPDAPRALRRILLEERDYLVRVRAGRPAGLPATGTGGAVVMSPGPAPARTPTRKCRTRCLPGPPGCTRQRAPAPLRAGRLPRAPAAARGWPRGRPGAGPGASGS